MVRLHLQLRYCRSSLQIEHGQAQLLDEGACLAKAIKSILRLLPVIQRRDVLLEARTQVLPCNLGFSVVGLELRFHDEQGRDAHEDGGITTLNLLIELRQSSLSALQQLAEHVELC